MSGEGAARRPAWLWTLLLLLATAGLAYLATAAISREGSVALDLSWPLRLSGPDDLARNLLVAWRLPRVLASMIVGAALSVAGLLLQGVTRNPLADPYLLGISGGAGLLVVFVRAMVPLPAIDWWLTPACAFVGATLATLVVIALARGGPRSEGRLTTVGLVLAGVVINALCAAMMQFILARLDPFHLRVTTLWLAGGVSYVAWGQLFVIAVLVAAAWVMLRPRAHQLNALALGGESAASVGVDADRLLRQSALLAGLLTALGVSVAGLLGYVGLIVPHVVRLLAGRDFRRTLPLALVAGALLMLSADSVARLAFAPQELPVGVITALLGCPTLLVLLRRQLSGRGAPS